MLIKFYWSNMSNSNSLSPLVDIIDDCHTNLQVLIINFLTDDEGLGIKHLKKWIDKGFIEIEKIKNEELDYYDMWGQAWGAEITKKNVIIYWGYDDTECKEKMAFESFYIILKRWREFLDSEPSKDYINHFEIPCLKYDN